MDANTEAIARLINEIIESNSHHISYSEKEASERLGFKNPDTLSRLRRRGRISYSNFSGRIRYTPQHLDDFVKKHEIKARSGK